MNAYQDSKQDILVWYTCKKCGAPMTSEEGNTRMPIGEVVKCVECQTIAKIAEAHKFGNILFCYEGCLSTWFESELQESLFGPEGTQPTLDENEQ